MAILDYCTGISQLVQNESTMDGSSGKDYTLESFNFSSDTELQARKLSLSSSLPYYFWSSFCFDSFSSSWGSRDFFTLGDGVDYVIKISCTSSEELEIYCNDGSGDTLIDTIASGEYFYAGDETRIDFELDRTVGSISLYINRDLYSSYSFDFSLNESEINTCTLAAVRGAGESNFSQIFFADEDSTLITMIQSQVESIGGYNDFSGTVDYVECISKTGDNNSMTSSSSGDKQSFNVEDRSSLVAGGDVVAVGVYCRINQDNSGNDQGRLLITDGAGNDVYSDYFTVDQYITPHRMIFDTSPSGTAFDYSTVYNWQIGIEVSENG
jgi:hypothetical protein